MARSDPTVVVIFDRFGPYHVARLNALATKVRVIGLEIFGETADYDWDTVSGAFRFEKQTLFPDASADNIDHEVLRDGLTSYLTGVRPDFVAVPGWSDLAALEVTLWCIKHNTPSILMSESSSRDAKRTPMLEFIKRQIVSSHGAALVGGVLHQAYLQELKFPIQAIFSGYDVVDNEYFSLHKHGGGRPVDGYFLTSARFIEKKNLARLILAYALCAEQYGPAMPNLKIVGGGGLEGELRVLIEQKGLSQKIILEGWLQYEQLPGIYAGAIALIHPSTTEQWGLVVNEAMASGLPVLVSERCGCAHDLVEDGVNGYLFDPQSVSEIAASMKRFLDKSHAEKLRMGQHSLDRISQFGPSSFAKGMVSAIACARRSKGSRRFQARLTVMGTIKLRQLYYQVRTRRS